MIPLLDGQEEWVDRSIVLGKRQLYVSSENSDGIGRFSNYFICSVQYYSADPSMIFSGVVACDTGVSIPPFASVSSTQSPLQISATDLEVLLGGITALGGQWRNGLTKDVTHLFALSPGSNKYETALHFQKHTGVKIVLPHWFDDAMKLGIAALPTEGYEWPDPRILRTHPDDGAPKTKSAVDRSAKKSVYRTALWSPGQDVPEPGQVHARDIWGGRRVMLSPSLGLTGGRREAVETGIRRTGGLVVEFEEEGGDGTVSEESKMTEKCHVLVTRFRAGAAYVKVRHCSSL